MERIRSRLNARKERVPIRMFDAGPEGFTGGLSAANSMRITGAPTATTTRDLAALVAMGALVRTGVNRAPRYRFTVPLWRPAPLEVTDIS
jgi:Fic family protein